MPAHDHKVKASTGYLFMFSKRVLHQFAGRMRILAPDTVIAEYKKYAELLNE